MAKNVIIGDSPKYELVAPVKILVKPGFSGDRAASSSLRRRSITLIEETSGSHWSGGGRESDNIYLVTNQAKRLETRQSQNETSVKIPDGEKKNVAFYLQHCFRLMYFTGMSTYNPDKKDDEGEKTMMRTLRDILQKAIFWIITIVSLGFAILYAKLNWLAFTSEVGLLKFVYIGSWFFAIVSDIYFVYLFAYQHKRIKEATEILDSPGNCTIEEVGFGKKKWKCRNPHKLITVMFAATVLACLMHPMGGYGVRGWTPEKLILHNSNKLSYKLFLWNSNDLEDNSTKLGQLDREYGTELTSLTVIMGISEIGLQFCHNMKMDTAQNMGVVVAVLVWLRNRYFGRKVKNLDFKYYNGNDAEELDSPEGIFAEFIQVKKENRILNGLTGGLLKIVHAWNLLQSAGFLMRCLDGSASLTELTFMLYGLAKAAVIYLFGKKAETENEAYKEWIREWAMHSTDPVFLARVPAILDGMTAAPLGVGRGKFLVAHGFIFRFIGFVGSIFMLEIDNDEGSSDEDD